MGFNLGNTLSMMIYQKSQRISLQNNSGISQDYVTSLIQVNCEIISSSLRSFSRSIFLPVQISIILVLMYFLIDLAFLTGLVLLSLTVLANV